MNVNPYLIGNIYLGGYVFANFYTLGLVLISIFLTVFVIVTIVNTGRTYTVSDTQAHALTFADTIQEGHGHLTFFTLLALLTCFTWAIVYFAQHAEEFGVWFAY